MLTSRIFCDGGAAPNPGPGAAGVHARKTAGTFSNHSVFYPHVTNNIAEATSYVAALRLAARWISEGEEHVNIVNDSELVFTAVTGASRVTDPKLIPIIQIAKDV